MEQNSRIPLGRLSSRVAQFKTILAALPVASRRQLWILLALIVFRAAIEVAGVASAYPLFALLAKPDSFSKSSMGQWLLAQSGLEEISALLLPFVAVYALILASSALAAAFITIQQYRFIYALQTEVSSKLLAGYLGKPYEFFLQRNVSVLTKNINVSAAEFSTGLVLYSLFFISSAVIFFALIVALMFFSPWVTLAAGAFLGVTYVLTVFVLRPRLAAWGVDRDAQMGVMFKCVEEALSGVREVKVSGSERTFVERFRFHASRYAGLNVKFQAANTAPSQLVQALIMILIAALLFGLAARGVVPSNIVPMLGVFYIAFSRMLPLGNQMYTNWVTICYFWPSVGIVYSGLTHSKGNYCSDRVMDASGEAKKAVRFRSLLQFDGVSFRYPSANKAAISEFSCDIRFGHQVAIIGRSGSGKSTVLDLLLGLIEPTVGEIRVDGLRLRRERLPAWRGQVGYVSQQVFLFDASLAENIAFGIPKSDIDYQAVEEAIQKASLGTVLARLPMGMNSNVGDRGIGLSGGERQRVGIARALYRRPRVLVLDEATSALDSETERAILRELVCLKEKITTIVVTHRHETLTDCDEIIRIGRA